jgi:hypothetical protein
MAAYPVTQIEEANNRPAPCGLCGQRSFPWFLVYFQKPKVLGAVKLCPDCKAARISDQTITIG